MSEEVTFRGENLGEVAGQVRRHMGRGVFIIPTRVMVGNTTPRDISDETGEPTLLFENTRIMEADIEIEEGGELVLTLPNRDEIHERFEENYDGGHELSDNGGFDEPD